ncbi:MAG: endonuclease domain-containing protein [bacterium]
MLKNRLTDVARRLRRDASEAEKALWRVLRGRNLEGLKFRRQYPMGNYIADFVCFEKRLIIEVDGGQHAVDTSGDERRDAWFRKEGFDVLRFWNHDVLTNVEGVVKVILERCNEPSPYPLPEGEGKKGRVG